MQEYTGPREKDRNIRISKNILKESEEKRKIGRVTVKENCKK